MPGLPVPTLRDAFVSTEVVTASQWDSVARNVTDGEAILTELMRAPAWWSLDGSDTAVTLFQLKLARALAASDKLPALGQWLKWGNYLLRDELGRGGMGAVYLARDLTTGEDVALKRVLKAARNQRQETRSRFRREGAILSRLDHPSIAKFRGLEHLHGADVLVMEYVPGESAARYVRRLSRQGKGVSVRRAVEWIRDLLDALAHAHARRVVHRDIKPGNVMLKGIGGRTVKLLDMGLAKCLALPDADCQLTQTGQILGTCEYMPPEQWRGADVTPAADLYALGGTLHFLLTGRSPYAGASIHQQMTQHLSNPVPSLRAARPDVPEALDTLLQTMMAKEPSHRGTARELRWQLESVLAARKPEVIALTQAVTPPLSSPTPASRASTNGRSATIVAADTTVTPRVWPLVREMGTELRRMVGLQKPAKHSVFEQSSFSRFCWLGVAAAGVLWAKLPSVRRTRLGVTQDTSVV